MDANMEVTGGRDKGERFSLLLLYLFTGVSISAVAVCLWYMFHVERHMQTVHCRLVGATKDVRIAVTQAHLLLEELLSGDQTIQIDSIGKLCDKAAGLTLVMLEGGFFELQTFEPIEDSVMRMKMRQVQSRLGEFREVGQMREAEPAGSMPGSVIDEKYDAVFGSLTALFGEVDSELERCIKSDQHRLWMIRAVLITVCIALCIVVAGILDRFIRGRIVDNKRFRAVNAQLVAAEQQLKAANEMLAASEQRYEFMFENMSSGVAVYEAVGNGDDFVFKSVNNAVARIDKISRGDLIGRSVLDIFPNVREFGIFEVFQRVWRTGKAEHFPVAMYKDNRISGWRENYIYRLPSGEVVAVYDDVTEREKLREEIEERNKELAGIIHVASHDLRSPLVNIQGFSQELARSCEVIRQELGDKKILNGFSSNVRAALERDIPEALSFILASAKKMNSLLAGLLHLSRVGRGALMIESLDMNVMVSGIIKSMEYQIQEAGVVVNVADLPGCLGDVTQINQVFSNILDNAIKYLDSTRNGVVRISGRVSGKESIYCVEDNGVGIAADHRERIFEIFHQLEPAGKEGEGLGLTIVKRILDRHHGKVWVESERNVGSRFFISLPNG
ncbi:MAG: ATP-binding protein [Planctomycetota bacterium]